MSWPRRSASDSVHFPPFRQRGTTIYNGSSASPVGLAFKTRRCCTSSRNPIPILPGVPVMTTGQGDLMRKGLVDDFKRVGLDRTKIVAGGGNGTNFGGVARHGAMTAHLVPAVHSNLHGFPSAGFI